MTLVPLWIQSTKSDSSAGLEQNIQQISGGILVFCTLKTLKHNWVKKVPLQESLNYDFQTTSVIERNSWFFFCLDLGQWLHQRHKNWADYLRIRINILVDEWPLTDFWQMTDILKHLSYILVARVSTLLILPLIWLQWPSRHDACYCHCVQNCMNQVKSLAIRLVSVPISYLTVQWHCSQSQTTLAEQNVSLLSKGTFFPPSFFWCWLEWWL